MPGSSTGLKSSVLYGYVCCGVGYRVLLDYKLKMTQHWTPHCRRYVGRLESIPERAIRMLKNLKVWGGSVDGSKLGVRDC